MISYWLTRFYFQRALGFIYCLGFLIAANQFRALCGEKGILPIRLFVKRIEFWDSPSLFWLNSSDNFILILAYLGLVLAVLATIGISDSFGPWVSGIFWFSLWLIYLSFVNVGQTFYSFGWKTLLLEMGFLSIFLGSSNRAPSALVIWLMRWILFRLMFGAGLIKLRGDECWRDLTCMNYHYETQPMPNPLSWYFHQLPEWVNKGAVLFTHFAELVVPFFYFAPKPLRHWAGVITIIFQGMLILSGNLSWLNYITIVLCIVCFDDSILPRLEMWTKSMGLSFTESTDTVIGTPLVYVVASVILLLSIKPTINLLSPRQMMNTSFEPLHLVNTYGAFGSITRKRFEVIIEGNNDLSSDHWQEYTFKGKPSEVERRPPIISPYHLRLDWQMWFAAMSSYEYHPWILSLIGKLLQGNAQVLSLFRGNPFGQNPPKYIRASLYEYNFADPSNKNWWVRKYVREYLPALSLDNPKFKTLLLEQGWSE